jgi:hypothetical protein
MTTARQFGSAPTTRELVDRLITVVADMHARIDVLQQRVEMLEAKHLGDEDGRPPPPLPPSWAPLQRAAKAVGYSPSMLRKLSDHCRAQWWQYRGSRVWVDTARCPRRL